MYIQLEGVLLAIATVFMDCAQEQSYVSPFTICFWCACPLPERCPTGLTMTAGSRLPTC